MYTKKHKLAKLIRVVILFIIIILSIGIYDKTNRITKYDYYSTKVNGSYKIQFIGNLDNKIENNKTKFNTTIIVTDSANSNSKLNKVISYSDNNIILNDNYTFNNINNNEYIEFYPIYTKSNVSSLEFDDALSNMIESNMKNDTDSINKFRIAILNSDKYIKDVTNFDIDVALVIKDKNSKVTDKVIVSNGTTCIIADVNLKGTLNRDVYSEIVELEVSNTDRTIKETIASIINKLKKTIK